MAWSVTGMQADFSDAGWLAVIASLSDLATTGATPFAITNDIEAPDTMDVEDLRRFATGVAEACRIFQVRHAGGNLGRSTAFGTHCTAVGILRGQQRVGRRFCRAGDYVVAIGPMGALAAAYLHAIREGVDNLSVAERRSLLRPMPQVSVMRNLVRQGTIHAASDCSDGVVGALANLVEASGLGIELELEKINIPQRVKVEAKAHGLSPWNVLFFWGDWQIVATTDRINDVRSISNPTNLTVLGRVVQDQPGLHVRVGDEVRPVALIRNENFRRDGFAGNLNEHLRFMLESPIF